MMTSMSGPARTTAATVCRIKRNTLGSCLITAEKPMIDNSSIGNSDFSPSLAIARPPTPSNLTASPRRWRSTFIRWAPSRSPDSSVAIRKILRATLPFAGVGIRKAARSRKDLPCLPPRSWLAGRRPPCCELRPPRPKARRRPPLRRFAVQSSADRSADPVCSWELSPIRRDLCWPEYDWRHARLRCAPAIHRCLRCPQRQPHGRRSRRRLDQRQKDQEHEAPPALWRYQPRHPGQAAFAWHTLLASANPARHPL